jgi:hypothetical protein
MHFKSVCYPYVLQEFLLSQSLFFCELVGKGVTQLHRRLEIPIGFQNSLLGRMVVLHHFELTLVSSSNTLKLHLHAFQLFNDASINCAEAEHSIFYLERLEPFFD